MRSAPECMTNLNMFIIVHPQYCYGQPIDYTINHPSLSLTVRMVVSMAMTIMMRKETRFYLPIEGVGCFVVWDNTSDAVPYLGRMTQVEVGVVRKLECQRVERVIHQDALPYFSCRNYVSAEQNCHFPVSGSIKFSSRWQQCICVCSYKIKIFPLVV